MDDRKKFHRALEEIARLVARFRNTEDVFCAGMSICTFAMEQNTDTETAKEYCILATKLRELVIEKYREPEAKECE